MPSTRQEFGSLMLGPLHYKYGADPLQAATVWAEIKKRDGSKVGLYTRDPEHVRHVLRARRNRGSNT